MQILKPEEFYFHKDNLNQLPELLTHFFGKDFVSCRVIRPSRNGKTALQIKREEARLHPLHKYWTSLEQAIQQTKSSDKICINEDTTFLIQLFFDLTLTKNVINIQIVVDKLKDNDKFLSTCFELQVANYYVKLGYEVIAIPEGKSKTTDFKVKINDEEFYVEAKLLEHKKNREFSQWQSFIGEIITIFNRNNLCLDAHLIAYDSFDKVDIPLIKEKIQWYCSSAVKEERDELHFKTANIAIQSTGNWNEPRGDALEFQKRGDVSQYSCSNQYGKMRNLQGCSISIFDPLNYAKTMRSRLEKAKNQLVVDGALVVHVGLPHRNSNHISEIADFIQKKISGDIKRNFKKINAVIVQSMSIEDHIGLLDVACEHQLIIGNPNCYIKLPSKFKFGFNGYLNFQEFPKPFKIGFDYDRKQVDQLLIIGICRTFVCFGSEDGNTQFRVFVNSNNSATLQLISPNLDIKSCNFDFVLENIRTGKRIVFNLDGEFIEISIDNRAVTKIQFVY
jgi:hypothetical protein